MKWKAEAPSNIALIKYMGKSSVTGNLPTNPSLSFTLNHLTSVVEMEESKRVKDSWEPLVLPKCEKVALSDLGKKRYLDHLAYLKVQFQLEGNFVIRSTNRFPLGCGLASSASSFAALTMCAAKVLESRSKIKKAPGVLSRLSQAGSGSSSRSFFSPWAQWDEDGAKQVDLPYKKLDHLVIVVAPEAKKISSSEAHKRVRSSLLFSNRPERAKQRFYDLKRALVGLDWKSAFEITWAEFWDMHALFETSDPSFGYMTKDTFGVLEELRLGWVENQDGPLVTMDAGPNIHLLFREDQKKMTNRYKKRFSKKYQVLGA